MTKELVDQLNQLERTLDSLLDHFRQLLLLALRRTEYYRRAQEALQGVVEHEDGYANLFDEMVHRARSLRKGLNKAYNLQFVVADLIRNRGDVSFPCKALSQCEASTLFIARYVVRTESKDSSKMSGIVLKRHQQDFLQGFLRWGEWLAKDVSQLDELCSESGAKQSDPRTAIDNVIALYKVELSHARKLLGSTQGVRTPEGGSKQDYLGISLNRDNLTICRQDRTPQSLTRLTFVLCKYLLDCKLNGATMEQVDNCLQTADFEKSARRQAIQTLKASLKPLGLTIPNAKKTKRYKIIDEDQKKLTLK